MAMRVNNQVVSPETKSLWRGEIEPWMNETQISSLFTHVANTVSVKIIKDKMTGLPAGYGFVEFETHETAKKVLDSLNGTPIPGLNKYVWKFNIKFRNFRLNWAVQSGGASRPSAPSSLPSVSFPGASTPGDFSVYVGDLDPNVTDSILLEAFSSRYKSVINANVIVDPITKRSKKYGFVRFSNQEESQRAIYEMSGKYILSRPIKLNVGYKKNNTQQNNSAPNPYGSAYPSYGQPPAPAYPTYPSYGGQDPYGMGKQSYGYGSQGSYGYSQPAADPYSQPPQYNYGGYYPPQPSQGSNPYGASQSSYPSQQHSGYDYGTQQSSYPSYDNKSAYPEPASTQQPSYPYQDPSQGYNYGYSAPAQPQVDPVPQTPAEPAPVQNEKEVDYEVAEKKESLFTSEESQKLNKEFFDQVMGEQGTLDIMVL